MARPQSSRSLHRAVGLCFRLCLGFGFGGAGKSLKPQSSAFAGLASGLANSDLRKLWLRLAVPGLLVLSLLCLSLPCLAQPGPARLQITPADQAITVGANLQLTARFAFIGNRGLGNDVSNQVIWQSSNGSVATVSSTGLVMASASNRGTVTITAIRGPFRGTTTLTVIPNATLTMLRIMPTNPSVPKGVPVQFTATGTFNGGATQDLTSAANWMSSNLGVASISHGLARTLGQGSSTITASFSGLSDSTSLTVTPPIVQSVVVQPQNPTVPLGVNQQFRAIGVLTDQSTQDLTNSAGWTSTNPAVASVNNTGLAMSRAQGSTTISASYSSLSGSTLLMVAPPALASIAVTPVNPTVHPGATLQLTAMGTFTDGSMQNLTSVVTWNSNNPSVASVNGSGLVAAANPGTATIVAYGTGFMGVLITGSTNLSVPALLSIAINPPNPTLAQGTSLQLSAIGSYSDGSNFDLTNLATWSSSNPAAAPVNSTGFITGNKVGFSTISATQGTITGSTGALIGFSALSLNGNYAFSFSGRDHDGVFLVAGSFVADGNGHLLSGVEDFNGMAGVLPNLSFTGSYTIGLDGRGSMSMTTGDTLKFVLTGPGDAVVIQFDNFAVASGNMAQQDPSAFVNLQGSFAYQLFGVSNGLIANVGQFTADGAGHIGNGQRDVNDTGTVRTTTFSGSYTGVAANGRGTMTLQNSDNTTTRYSYYIVGRDRIYIVSLDFNPAFLGVAHVRNGSSFSNVSLGGYYVFSESGFTTTDQFQHTKIFNAAGVWFANGAGTFSQGRQDFNEGGTVRENAGASGNYNVASNGRCTATIDGFPYVCYVVSRSLAYFMNTDSGGVLTRTLQSQPSIIFSTASFEGNFNLLLSGQDLIGNGSLAMSGQMFADGAGTLSGTEDINDNASLSSNIPLNGSYSVEDDGRGTGTINGPHGNMRIHFYMVDFDHLVFVETDSNNDQIGSAEFQF